VAPAFRLAGRAVRAEPLGEGLINRTFRVTVCGGGQVRRYVLQAINRSVFPRPELLMANLRRITAHLARIAAERGESHRRSLRLVPTVGGADFWVDPDGRWWRAFHHIERALTVQEIASPARARRAAAAFGRFVRDLHTLPGPALHTPIPGFHDTRGRLDALLAAAQADPCGRAAGARPLIERILARKALAGVLEEAREAVGTALTPVHNDTKINNLLFDRRSGEALCVIDLDTVMPGLLLHDFGDMVRSGASSAGGGAQAPYLRMELYAAMLRGWLGEVGPLLGAAERELLATAPRVITLELAARFLTDHLQGDAYFRTRRPGENLSRCRSQLDLLESMEARAGEMERLARAVLRRGGA
jgi:hypothetical protein